MLKRSRVLACVAIASITAIGGVSVVRAGPLIPGLPDAPGIPEVPGTPGSQQAHDPQQTAPDAKQGSPVPTVCTGGVLKPGGELQGFANSLRAGETGCLRGEIYEGGVDLRKPGVRLRSYPGKRATISGGQVRISPLATGATLKKLRLVSDQFSPLIYASGAVIAENEITNNNSDICVLIDSATGSAVPTGVVIRQNRIHDCGRLPATNQDHGIYVADAQGTVIRDNLIYDNADRGVQLYPDARGTHVFGNVIDGNGQGVIFGRQSDQNVVEDNIISNSHVRHNVESATSSAGGNVVRGNCLWSTNAGYGGEPLGSGVLPGPGFSLGSNTIADPRFKNRVNFRPAPGSPCAGIGPSR